MAVGAGGGAIGGTAVGTTPGVKGGKIICGCIGTKYIPGGTAASDVVAIAIIAGGTVIGVDDGTATVAVAASAGVEINVLFPTPS